jgi:hypothetical protein
MKILITDSQNKTEFIFAQESWNGGALKKAIKEKYQLQDDDMELVFNGNILEDSDSLLAKGITDGKTINFLGKFSAGGEL